MPFNQVINYDTDGNFVFDPAKIEIAAGKARLRLIPNPGQIFNQDFASDAGFTYDNALAEFTGGVVRTKDQSPTDSVMASRLTAQDLNWNKAGALTGTLNGTPTFDAEGMDCAGAANGVFFTKVTAASETIRFRWKSPFTGAPPTNSNMVSGHTGGNNDRWALTYSPSGSNFRITLHNNTGTEIYSTNIFGAAFSATSGQEYEMAIVFDSAAGTVRHFVDGTLRTTLTPGVWARGGVTQSYYVGATPNLYNIAYGVFSDVIWYNAALWTATYTPGYTIAPFLYATSKVDLPAWPYTGVGSILTVDDTTILETGLPRYILGGRHWDGAAWSASDGSYAQANTSAVAMANLVSFNASGASMITASVVFPESNTLSSVDDIDVEVTGQIYPLDNPTIVNASGVNADELFSFLATVVAAGSDAVQFVLVVSGVDKHWNGSAWANSNGTYAQSNPAATINTNIGSLDLSVGHNIKVKAFLHADPGQTTPELEMVSFSYDFFAPAPADPSRCVLFGFLNDMIGLIKDTPQQAKLIVETFSVFNYGDRMIGPYRRVFRFNANGYVETTPAYLETADATAEDGLVETETLSLTPYKLTVQYRNSDGKLVTFGVDGIEVPNQVSKNLKEYDFA